MPARTIAHVRLDHLPSAVAVRADRDLALRPHVVAFAQSGARVLDASGQAEARGVRRGMSVWEAQALAPGLQVVAPDTAGLHEAHQAALGAALQFTPQIQPVSLSELTLDVTGSLRLYGGKAALCTRLAEELLAATGAWGTVGLAPNPLVARMAAELACEGAVCDMTEAPLPEALAQLPLQMLVSVDAAKRARLAAMGIRTLGQLRLVPSMLLRREFGEAGEAIYQAARGQDATAVPVYELGDPALVVRHRTELPRATREASALRTAGLGLAQVVAASLRMRRQATRELRLAVVLRDRATMERRRALPEASGAESVLWGAVEGMLQTVTLGARLCVAVELTAMQLAEGSAGQQLSLFDHSSLREAHLAAVRDRLASRGPELVALPASQLGTAA